MNEQFVLTITCCCGHDKTIPTSNQCLMFIFGNFFAKNTLHLCGRVWTKLGIKFARIKHAKYILLDCKIDALRPTLAFRVFKRELRININLIMLRHIRNCNKWNLSHYFGKDTKIQKMEKWMDQHGSSVITNAIMYLSFLFLKYKNRFDAFDFCSHVEMILFDCNLVRSVPFLIGDNYPLCKLHTHHISLEDFISVPSNSLAKSVFY